MAINQNKYENGNKVIIIKTSDNYKINSDSAYHI